MAAFASARARPRLFVTQRLPEPVEARLTARYDTTIHQGSDILSPQALVQAAAEADALAVFPGDRLDEAVLTALSPRVKIVASFSAGTDHVHLPTARLRRITVTNTPGVIATATAELTLLLMLACARRMTEAWGMLRGGLWPGIRPTQLLGMDLAGKTLGIVGLGAIGRQVARRALAFQMRILYHNRSPLPEGDLPEARFVPALEDLLGAADIVSLHCPLTVQTRHLIDAAAVARMRPGAILINTARGPILDEPAVIAAVTRGHLGAVGLDVFDGEPAINPAWFDLDRVVMLPHLGTATRETRVAMGMKLADNLDAFFRDEIPPNAV